MLVLVTALCSASTNIELEVDGTSIPELSLIVVYVPVDALACVVVNTEHTEHPSQLAHVHLFAHTCVCDVHIGLHKLFAVVVVGVVTSDEHSKHDWQPAQVHLVDQPMPLLTQNCAQSAVNRRILLIGMSSKSGLPLGIAKFATPCMAPLPHPVGATGAARASAVDAIAMLPVSYTSFDAAATSWLEPTRWLRPRAERTSCSCNRPRPSQTTR